MLEVIAAIALLGAVAVPSACAMVVTPTAREIVQRADRQRGLEIPYRFRARIASQAPEASTMEDAEGAPSTLVEVRANGFAQQLVFVLEPIPGDVMLVTPDVLWLRPRRLHRLTRIPPDLRVFGGASISDVTSVDVLSSYAARLREETGAAADYVVDLDAGAGHVHYPRATYRVRRDDFRPLQIDFLAASGKPLKSVRYEEFAVVLGRTIPTRLLVDDHVYRDTTTVLLSDFEPVAKAEAATFGPEYLLALPDGAP